eukprot:TRINITY_DN12498_c1_g1_i1.p2 TRINITY_DN12498_c1_g1~~TRINITY_DN12498_c1_g1_i1.p2  ORF type:complete len:286 (+),score=14.00 TRINITY_DN12498_c1_g1_i1:1-858(+)
MAAIRYGTRPDKLVAFLLKNMSREFDAYSLAEKEQILFSCCLINYQNIQNLQHMTANLERQLQQRRFEPQKYPRIWCGLIYSIIMLRLENFGQNAIDMCLANLEEMNFEKIFVTYDAATLLIFALASLQKNTGPLLKSVLVTLLTEDATKMTKLHIVHAFYGLNVLGWIEKDGDAQMVLCARLNQLGRQLSPVQVCEVLYGMAISGVQHFPLTSKLLLRAQVMIKRGLVSQDQVRAILQCFKKMDVRQEDFDNLLNLTDISIEELNSELPDIRELFMQKKDSASF